MDRSLDDVRSMDGDREWDGIVMWFLVVTVSGEEGDQSDLFQHVQVDGIGASDQEEDE